MLHLLINVINSKIMERLKLFTVVVLIAMTVNGCIEGDNYIRYSDYITLEAGPLPDTMVLNQSYNIILRASAPNTCWSNLQISVKSDDDSLYAFSALGTFENHGEECLQQLITLDSVYVFTPKVLKTHVLMFLNPSGDPQVRVDTVYIKEN